MEYQQLIEDTFRSSVEHIETALTACRSPLAGAIRKAITLVERGGTLFFAGNGGSAADASHAASELIGSFEHYTAPIPALALTTDTAIITSIANDFSFDHVFLQQVRALVKPGDQLWVISTSGHSMNLFYAAAWAREQKVSTVGLLGRRGGRILNQVDYPIVIPGDNTQRIQEVHILILHTLASALKRKFPEGVNLPTESIASEAPETTETSKESDKKPLKPPDGELDKKE
jgi:D-sedoheptulose 7-phosphate isomerase